MSLVLFLAISGFGLSIYSSVAFNEEVAKLIYFFLGVFVMPFEIIFHIFISNM
jgi:hypothetical protein